MWTLKVVACVCAPKSIALTLNSSTITWSLVHARWPRSHEPPKWNCSEWTPLRLGRKKAPKIVHQLREMCLGDGIQGANVKWFKKAIKLLRNSNAFLAGGEGEDVFEFKVFCFHIVLLSRTLYCFGFSIHTS